jgi:NifU-like protein involved in Fe-S cluster formation
VNVPLYTTEILRLAASLHEWRHLARVDGRAELRSQTCGSAIATLVMLDDGGSVVALSQSVRACAFGQASAALLEQGVLGRTASDVEHALVQLADWLGGRREDPGEWPGLAALAPAHSKIGRHGAILLPFRALLAAMQSTR